MSFNFYRKNWQQLSRNHFLKVANQYDTGRVFEQADFWAREIVACLPLSPGDRLLDLGCGTGLYTLPFAQLLPCAVVGLDPSPIMLAKAKVKAGSAISGWLQGQGETLPFPDSSFQAIFLSQVWHHLENGLISAAEFYRVLKAGGGLFVKTFSHDQLRARWDITTVFPELLPLMLNIYPDIPDFVALFNQVGFANVGYKTHQKSDSLRPSVLLKIAEDELWSMFAYLSEQGYRTGSNYLQQLIAETNDAPLPYDEMHLLIYAQKE
jgi:ubiquinone/menaquinone biosynthesis C-methylase UbiE